MTDVVRSWKTAPRKLTIECKTECLRVIDERGITQEEIASACGVNHSTVSRWFDVMGDMQFPVAFIPCLNTEHLRSLAMAMLNFCAEPLGHTIGIRYKPLENLNADLTDETLEITQYVGRLAEKMKSGEIDARKCERILRDLKTVVERGIEECKQLGEKS